MIYLKSLRMVSVFVPALDLLLSAPPKPSLSISTWLKVLSSKCAENLKTILMQPPVDNAPRKNVRLMNAFKEFSPPLLRSLR